MYERIGPIPAVTTVADEVRWGDAPGSIATTRPAWGGYLPARVRDDVDWHADTTDTRLVLGEGGWYVERPARPYCRAVVIATEAILEGAEPPPGILPEEVAKAREILASDDPRAWAWAASGGWELPAWPVPPVEPTEAEEVVSSRGA